MLAILHLLGAFIANLFKSRRRLEVENLYLRHQLNIALRRAPHRLRLLTWVAIVSCIAGLAVSIFALVHDA